MVRVLPVIGKNLWPSRPRSVILQNIPAVTPAPMISKPANTAMVDQYSPPVLIAFGNEINVVVIKERPAKSHPRAPIAESKKTVFLDRDSSS